MTRNTLRSLAALPLCAALGFAGNATAQSSVTIYGTLDLGANQLRTTTAAGVKTRLTSVAGGGIQTPFLGFRGSEDLGGGLSANFLLNTYMTRMDSGAAARSDTEGFWSAAANVGLTSRDWGSIRLGRISTPTIVAMFDTNAWIGSTTYGSAFVNTWAGLVQGDTVMSNAVRYDTPRLAGFQGQIMYTLGEERASGPDQRFGKGFDWRIDYLNGPVRATVSGRSLNQSANNNGREHDLIIVGGSYDFTAARVFAQYVSLKDHYTVAASNVDRSGASVGVRVPVGQAVLIASTGRNSIDDLNPATPSRKTTTSLGIDYLLSKRTDIYAGYIMDRLTKPTGNKSVRFGVGIRHSF